MTDEQIIKLIKNIEVAVCGLLIEKGICNYTVKPKPNAKAKTHNNFYNLTILEPYASELGAINIDLDYVKEIRNLYPSGSDRKGTPGVISTKLKRFLSQNPEYTVTEIIDIIAAYVTDKEYSGETDMLFNLDNLFYKKENGSEKSPILGLIEKYQKKDINNQEVFVLNNNE